MEMDGELIQHHMVKEKDQENVLDLYLTMNF